MISQPTINSKRTVQIHHQWCKPTRFSMQAFKGTNPDTVIVLGTIICQVTSKSVAIHAIFNAKSLMFECIGNGIFDKYNNDIDVETLPKFLCNIKESSFAQEYLCDSSDDDEVGDDGRNNIYDYNYKVPIEYLPFWGNECRFNKYKNYIIVSGTPNITIRIYDVSDDYKPRLIMYFEDEADFSGEFGIMYHGCVILPDNCNYNYVATPNDEEHEIATLLVIGGLHDMCF